MNLDSRTKILIFILGCTLFTNGCSSHSGSDQSFVLPPKNGDAGTPIDPPGSLPGSLPGGTVTDFKLKCSEAQFIHLLNIYRTSQGRLPLNVSKSGVLAARWHAQDMSTKNYFSHTEPSGRNFSTRTLSFGYIAKAENIAAGNSSASATFCQWKNSLGHNINMLGENHQSAGIGIATGTGDYSVYWSSCFGAKASDEIAEPLTVDDNCQMPIEIPSC